MTLARKARQNHSPRDSLAKTGDEKRGIDNGVLVIRALQLLANARCHMLVGTNLGWLIYWERWSLHMGESEACQA